MPITGQHHPSPLLLIPFSMASKSQVSSYNMSQQAHVNTCSESILQLAFSEVMHAAVLLKYNMAVTSGISGTSFYRGFPAFGACWALTSALSND